MYVAKQERDSFHIPKREEPKKTFRKTINCVNCNNIVAVGIITQGRIEIDCKGCGTKNIIEAVPKNGN